MDSLAKTGSVGRAVTSGVPIEGLATAGGRVDSIPVRGAAQAGGAVSDVVLVYGILALYRSVTLIYAADAAPAGTSANGTCKTPWTAK